jgi:hypothetical protein
LVPEPWQYPWSSWRAYALGEADTLLDRNPLYEELAPNPQRRQQLWRDFLLGADDKEEAVRKATGPSATRRFVCSCVSTRAGRARGAADDRGSRRKAMRDFCSNH